MIKRHLLYYTLINFNDLVIIFSFLEYLHISITVKKYDIVVREKIFFIY